MLVTGAFGGMEVGLGVMAYLAVLHETHNHLLAGLAFGIGFIALLLAKSELFTEGFLVPIAAVASKEASLGQLAKLWSGTLAMNLVGGWAFMWIVVQAFPHWRPELETAARHFVEAGFSWQSVCLAVLGGSTITLMTACSRARTRTWQKWRWPWPVDSCLPGCSCSTPSWIHC